MNKKPYHNKNYSLWFIAYKNTLLEQKGVVFMGSYNACRAMKLLINKKGFKSIPELKAVKKEDIELSIVEVIE